MRTLRAVPLLLVVASTSVWAQPAPEPADQPVAPGEPAPAPPDGSAAAPSPAPPAEPPPVAAPPTPPTPPAQLPPEAIEGEEEVRASIAALEALPISGYVQAQYE